MNLPNEAILVRTLIGAILGLLVNFGVKLSGVQVDAIMALADAVIPLALALIGALSARGKVDGPETAKDKAATIARLEELLHVRIEAEKPPPTPRNIGPVSLLLLVFGVACSGAQVREAATCSPKADAWFQLELKRVCGVDVETKDCPEAEAIGDEYERREQQECAQ